MSASLMAWRLWQTRGESPTDEWTRQGRRLISGRTTALLEQSQEVEQRESKNNNNILFGDLEAHMS